MLSLSDGCLRTASAVPVRICEGVESGKSFHPPSVAWQWREARAPGMADELHDVHVQRRADRAIDTGCAQPNSRPGDCDRSELALADSHDAAQSHPRDARGERGFRTRNETDWMAGSQDDASRPWGMRLRMPHVPHPAVVVGERASAEPCASGMTGARARHEAAPARVRRRQAAGGYIIPQLHSLPDCAAGRRRCRATRRRDRRATAAES